MLMDSRSHELIAEKGKIGCPRSTMTRTQLEILRHPSVTQMAGVWNQLEASSLIFLPFVLGCLKKLGSAATLTLGLSLWLRLLAVWFPKRE